ncbi:cysteine proteinase [Hypoxylon sp. NC0597]|nr:cysteine proteinase [Hypoxylon sp. NC0597]
MPGAWPSELDEEDSREAPTNNNMAFPNGLGTNIRSAVNYLRDSSYNLYTTLSNKFFGSNHQIAAIPAASYPEDDGHASKRRRLVVDEYENEQLITPPESIGDSMDIDDHVDVEHQHTELRASPSLSPTLSPNSRAASAAARRATKLFPVGKKISPKRRQTQVATPPPEDEDEDDDKQPLRRIEPTTEPRVWGPLPPPKYKNILEFFEHDNEHGLPGFEHLGMKPKDAKMLELDKQREERLRIEAEKAEKERQEKLRREEARLNEALRPLGLRRTKNKLITTLSPFWEQKAVRAPEQGYAPPSKWKGAVHREGVELTTRDFTRLVPPSAWLNDNAIQASLVHLATFINDTAGISPKKDTPKCVALSSQYWSNFLSDTRNKLYSRGLERTWGLKPQNMMGVDTILIPVNESNHWTLIIIRPSRRTIAYVDSFQSVGTSHLRNAHTWLEKFLGDKYVAEEWRTEQYKVPEQTNGYDCGVFVITNSIYLSLGIDPSDYSQEDMPLQRLRIAAMLLNGGFTGEFDLSHL